MLFCDELYKIDSENPIDYEHIHKLSGSEITSEYISCYEDPSGTYENCYIAGNYADRGCMVYLIKDTVRAKIQKKIYNSSEYLPYPMQIAPNTIKLIVVCRKFI